MLKNIICHPLSNVFLFIFIHVPYMILSLKIIIAPLLFAMQIFVSIFTHTSLRIVRFLQVLFAFLVKWSMLVKLTPMDIHIFYFRSEIASLGHVMWKLRQIVYYTSYWIIFSIVKLLTMQLICVRRILFKTLLDRQMVKYKQV